MTAEVVPARSLAECEQVIERGLAVFTEVGLALVEIRDARLYRQAHGTFEEYCQERWGFSRVRAHQIIEATETTKALTIVNAPLPANEGQARALTGLTTETAAEVMTEAAESGKITAASIQEARERIAPRPQPERHLHPVTPYVRPQRTPEWSAQKQAEQLVENFAANVCDTYAYGLHPERREGLIEAWRIGQIGASPSQRAYVTPERFRQVAAGFLALAEEWEEQS